MSLNDAVPYQSVRLMESAYLVWRMYLGMAGTANIAMMIVETALMIQY